MNFVAMRFLLSVVIRLWFSDSEFKLAILPARRKQEPGSQFLPAHFAEGEELDLLPQRWLPAPGSLELDHFVLEGPDADFNQRRGGFLRVAVAEVLSVVASHEGSSPGTLPAEAAFFEG